MDRKVALVGRRWPEVYGDRVGYEYGVRTEAVHVFGGDALDKPTIGVLDVQYGHAARLYVEEDIRHDARLSRHVRIDHW